jgi:hypothetical protein
MDVKRIEEVTFERGLAMELSLDRISSTSER